MWYSHLYSSLHDVAAPASCRVGTAVVSGMAPGVLVNTSLAITAGAVRQGGGMRSMFANMCHMLGCCHKRVVYIIHRHAQAVLYKVESVLLPPSTNPLVPGSGATGVNVTVMQALQGRPVSSSCHLPSKLCLKGG
jgi:hypothetical protein